MESLAFQVKTLLGGYKNKVQGGWKVGQFHMRESSSRGAGFEPLHLVSDGSFAAFGRIPYKLSQLDDETWWERCAPEAILQGLKELRASLENA